VGPIAAGCLLAACGGGDLVLPVDDDLQIRVVDGDGQRGPVGEPLSAPVVVEVTHGGGTPAEGMTVDFAFTSAGAGAEIAPAVGRTDAAGRAQAHLLLGDKVGLQTGEARVVVEAGGPSTTFSALALVGGNGPPRAEFDWRCDDLTCRFTESSSDADGEVAAWAWEFGDGASSTSREPTHRYATPGSYTVTLTVTDDDGATGASSHEVNPSAPAPAPPSNKAPKAEFEVSCDDLRCTFTDRSTDEDGSIETREWDFGDGATSSQRNPSHSYQSPGQYDVLLVVTDDDGAAHSRTRTAEPESPAAPPPPPPPPSNQPPQAEFEAECRELRCTFVDRSEDGDGSIASWEWDFADGATSRERNPSHSYAASGTYQVLLKVTDDDGAADTRTHSVRPEAAPPPPPPPPPASNEPPKAEFKVECKGLTCTFVDESKDDDGTIVRWDWSFGDGATSSEQNPVHTYAGKGNHDVLLTVTDDLGASNTKKRRADPKD
jgi:PKD repeat protein